MYVCESKSYTISQHVFYSYMYLMKRKYAVPRIYVNILDTLANNDALKAYISYNTVKIYMYLKIS